MKAQAGILWNFSDICDTTDQQKATTLHQEVMDKYTLKQINNATALKQINNAHLMQLHPFAR